MTRLYDSRKRTRVTGELRAVVHPQALGVTSRAGRVVEFFDDPICSEVGSCSG